MGDAVLPLAEVKKRLSEVVDGVEQRHERVVLTRFGKPAAVIVSPDDLEALEETVALLTDPQAMGEIRTAEEEIEAGNFVTGEELRERFLDH